MRKATSNSAVLPDLPGVQLPAFPLTVAAQYQFCVDAGAASAIFFFDDLTAIGLHDHVGLCMRAFIDSIEATSPASQHGQLVRVARQACIDAFAAGYLGRVHQELRLVRGRPGAAHGVDDVHNRRRHAH